MIVYVLMAVIAVLLIMWEGERFMARFWHERADDWYEYGRRANDALIRIHQREPGSAAGMIQWTDDFWEPVEGFEDE